MPGRGRPLQMEMGKLLLFLDYSYLAGDKSWRAAERPAPLRLPENNAELLPGTMGGSLLHNDFNIYARN